MFNEENPYFSGAVEFGASFPERVALLLEARVLVDGLLVYVRVALELGFALLELPHDLPSGHRGILLHALLRRLAHLTHLLRRLVALFLHRTLLLREALHLFRTLLQLV